MGRSLNGRLFYGAIIPYNGSWDDKRYPWSESAEGSDNPWYVEYPEDWIASLFGATAASTQQEIRDCTPSGVDVRYASRGDDVLSAYICVCEVVQEYDSGIIEFDPTTLLVPPGVDDLVHEIAKRAEISLKPSWLFAYTFG